MSYSLLVILVEGDDDVRFFERVVTPHLRHKFHQVKLWPYAQEHKRSVKAFLRSLVQIGADYLYVVDLNGAPCVTSRKQVVRRRLAAIDETRIVVVSKEIEAWYLAGIDDSCCGRLRIPRNSDTDAVTKERFKACMPRRFSSKVDFMAELMKLFD